MLSIKYTKNSEILFWHIKKAVTNTFFIRKQFKPPTLIYHHFNLKYFMAI